MGEVITTSTQMKSRRGLDITSLETEDEIGKKIPLDIGVVITVEGRRGAGTMVIRKVVIVIGDCSGIN